MGVALLAAPFFLSCNTMDKLESIQAAILMLHIKYAQETDEAEKEKILERFMRMVDKLDKETQKRNKQP